MGRKPNSSSPYIVGIHRTGKYVYASTQRQILDGNGTKTFRHFHWGKLLEDKMFVPNSSYYECPVEELRKLVFPPNWDISAHLRHLKSFEPGRPANEGEYSNKLYGDVWLLEQIANETELTKDIEDVFDGDKRIVDEILTLAFYLIVEEASFSRLKAFQNIIRFPAKRSLTSTVITRLMQSITEKHRQKLFSLRIKRLSKHDLVSVDSTSRSSYGNELCDIKWGKNKESLPLRQTVEVVVYSLTTHVPVYYRTFPGNMPDSRSLETILTELEHAGFKKMPIVTDRGYESIRNLEMNIRKGQSMIMCTKTSQKHVQEIIDKTKVGDVGEGDMKLDFDSRLYSLQREIEYKINGNGGSTIESKRLCLNLYLDKEKRTSQLLDLDWELGVQKKALEELMTSKQKVEDDETLKKLYSWHNLEVDQTTRLLKSYNVNEKKVEKAKKSAGFFAITTHGVKMDAMDVFSTYRLRNEQEKCFELMKSVLGARRQRNWSEDGKTGSLFVLFVSMIIGSWLRYKWKTCLKDAFKSSSDVLDEMKSIRCIEHTGRAKVITPFVGAQSDICKALGYEIPDGCSSTYNSKRIVKPKKKRKTRKDQLISSKKM